MKRLLASSPAAIGVVLGLFIFMIGLIHQEAPATMTENRGVVVFPTLTDTPDKPKPRPTPPEPPEEIEQPKETTPTVTKIKPKIDPTIAGINPSFTGLKIKPIGSIGKGFANTDGDATSTVTIEPQYPPKAIQKNLEGWVKLGYDINNEGRVENVQILAAKPRGIFEKSARRALYKWKYNPSVVDGVAVASIGHEVMLEFNLEKD